MAEGGETFGNPDELPDPWEYENEQGADTTRPFNPGAASTPYHGGEQHEMQTMMHEHGGPASYDERTPLISKSDQELERRLANLRKNHITGLIATSEIPDARVNPLSEEDKQEQIERVKRLIKSRFPNANVDALKIRYSTKNPMDLVVLGPKGGETKIVLGDGSDLQKSFIEKAFVKKTLGSPAKDLLQKTSLHIIEKQKELKDLRNSDKLLRDKDEEIQNLNKRLNMEQAKIDQLKESQGPDNEAEIKRKQQIVKNLERELKSQTKKDVEELQKKNEKTTKYSRKDPPT